MNKNSLLSLWIFLGGLTHSLCRFSLQIPAAFPDHHAGVRSQEERLDETGRDGNSMQWTGSLYAVWTHLRCRSNRLHPRVDQKNAWLTMFFFALGLGCCTWNEMIFMWFSFLVFVISRWEAGTCHFRLTQTPALCAATTQWPTSGASEPPSTFPGTGSAWLWWTAASTPWAAPRALCITTRWRGETLYTLIYTDPPEIIQYKWQDEWSWEFRSFTFKSRWASLWVFLSETYRSSSADYCLWQNQTKHVGTNLSGMSILMGMLCIFMLPEVAASTSFCYQEMIFFLF